MSSAQSSTGVVGMLMRVLAPDKPLRVLIAGSFWDLQFLIERV
jgi:hypothetical protein